MYMDYLMGKTERQFANDAVYRFMKSIHINWMKFTTAVPPELPMKSWFLLLGKTVSPVRRSWRRKRRDCHPGMYCLCTQSHKSERIPLQMFFQSV